MDMDRSLELGAVSPPKTMAINRHPKVVHSTRLLSDAESLPHHLPDLSAGFRAEVLSFPHRLPNFSAGFRAEILSVGMLNQLLYWAIPTSSQHGTGTVSGTKIVNLATNFYKLDLEVIDKYPNMCILFRYTSKMDSRSWTSVSRLPTFCID